MAVWVDTEPLTATRKASSSPAMMVMSSRYHPVILTLTLSFLTAFPPCPPASG